MHNGNELSETSYESEQRYAILPFDFTIPICVSDVPTSV